MARSSTPTAVVTQGRPLSPKLFNIMVDAIVKEWLHQVLSANKAESGIGTAIRYFVVLFYADDGYIASTDPAMLQDSLHILIALFERVGLLTNTSKTKAETCMDRKI